MNRDISILYGETVVTAAYTYSETYDRPLCACLNKIQGDNSPIEATYLARMRHNRGEDYFIIHTVDDEYQVISLPDELTMCAQALFEKYDEN